MVNNEKNKTTFWRISHAGVVIGTLEEQYADDEKDAVLNWADENLTAKLVRK